MGEQWNVDRLTAEWLARGLSRRDLMRLVAAGASASILTPLLPAVSPGVEAQTPVAGGQVSMLWKKPVTLHPLFSTAGYEQQVERLMFGALVKMTDKLDPVPDLAEKIDVSPDAKTYTFTLRPNLKFNDGEPLTARDVVFTIERAVDARTGSYWQGRLIGIAGAEAYSTQDAQTISGIETPDDRTVKITLAEPDAAFLVSLGSFSGLGILPAHVLKDVPPDQMAQHSFALAPTVSAGAFEFVTYQTDQYLELQPNETYAGPAPALDRLFLRILQQDTALAALERGELDLLSVPVEEVERVKTIPNVTVVSVPSPSMDQIGINLDRPYFQDKRVRQAMMYAIDRQAIVEAIYKGEARVINSPIIGPDWMGTPEFTPYAFDVEKARQLLQEAGWDSSQRVELMLRSDISKIRVTIAPIIQEQLRAAGIAVELLQVEGAEANRKFIQESDYDLYFYGGGVYRADPSIAALYYHSRNLTPGGGNGTRYVNPEVDALFQQGQATTDLEERKRIYTEVARILNEDVPTVYLWSPNSIFATSRRLQGFAAPSYVDNQLWNASDWWVSG